MTETQSERADALAGAHPTRVVAVGIGVDPTSAAAPDVTAVSAAEADEVMAEIVSLAESDRPTLVAYPGWSAAGRALAGSIRRHRIASGDSSLYTVRIELPPLAAAVLVGGLGRLARRIEQVGLLLGVADRYRRSIVHYGYARSLRGILRPRATIGLRLRAMLSRRPITLTPGRSPEIRVGSGFDVDAIAALKRPRLVVSTVGDAQRSWPRAQFAQTAIEIVESAPAPGVAQYWGAADVCEVVLHSSDVDAVADSILRERRVSTCRGCKALIISATCPICAMVHSADASRSR